LKFICSIKISFVFCFQQTNCKNRQIQCSFCQEKFASNDTLKAHLLSCGNKTEQCPNCRQLIRRSHFAYHYENHCAPVDQVETPPRLPKNPENRRPQVNPNLPVARTDVPPTFNSAKITECEYCYEKCSTDDLLAHTVFDLFRFTKQKKKTRSFVRRKIVLVIRVI